MSDATPVIRLTARHEAFCQAMAANVGGAEAARRAGYSPKGAKQRGAYLMARPEIRIRVDQLRAARSAGIEVELKEAAETVKAIIADAMEKKQCALALRAVELRLKLCGIMLDKRIPHLFTAAPHPDADLEAHDFDPAEENDGRMAGAAVEIVTSNSDPAPRSKTAPKPAPFAPRRAPALMTSTSLTSTSLTQPGRWTSAVALVGSP
ncbi:terminase small subunit (plasmid) [Skermanella sp. TT6]|uniref:Terminase small subunit n=1 Tax=Skermanella cutis TaxID=2775420 RepID=A0ABX7BGU6_9PROT|nr:terminase small subunit [Skermanella sp. TT6]QQP93626.1 terminase small subunit [Skermanella sp. TT6]